MKKSSVRLLVGTKKGAFFYRSDASREKWKLEASPFFGEIINHAVLDPRDGKTILIAARTGHLGPTVFRSSDAKTWQEASQPPAFPKATNPKKGKSVQQVFWLSPGHPSEPAVWWAGIVPGGLFCSEDGGQHWEEVTAFSRYLERLSKKEGLIGEPPGGGPIVHSIRIDPRDAQHMYVSVSSGGVFESKDRGKTWQPLNQGLVADYLPPPPAGPWYEYGQDPHNLGMHPLNPDRLYQQNHCGVYRLDRAEGVWSRIGDNLPKEVGDIGFGIVLHPKDPDTVWVFPMDGTSVWPRTSPGGKPAVFKSTNAGASWKRQAGGFPKANAHFTALRQAFVCDQQDPLGLYLGTSSGEVWASRDEGASWQQIAQHLPYILCVEAG
jgi:photosystem II stability/assembly factor-like uncharacterized protein